MEGINRKRESCNIGRRIKNQKKKAASKTKNKYRKLQKVNKYRKNGNNNKIEKNDVMQNRNYIIVYCNKFKIEVKKKWGQNRVSNIWVGKDEKKKQAEN